MLKKNALTFALLLAIVLLFVLVGVIVLVVLELNALGKISENGHGKPSPSAAANRTSSVTSSGVGLARSRVSWPTRDWFLPSTTAAGPKWDIPKSPPVQ